MYCTLYKWLRFTELWRKPRKKKLHNWYTPFIPYFCRISPLFIPHMICVMRFGLLTRNKSCYDAHAFILMATHLKYIFTQNTTMCLHGTIFFPFKGWYNLLILQKSLEGSINKHYYINPLIYYYLCNMRFKKN